MSAIFNLANLTGSAFKDWKPDHTTTKESHRMGTRHEIRAAVADGPKSFTELKDAIEGPNLSAALAQMTNEGQLKRKGEGTEAVYSAGREPHADAKKPKAAKRTAAPAAPKERKPKEPKPKARKPKANGHATTAPRCNVTPFTPAITADKRLVIVGGSEPLMFSIEQTQNIADLVFGNFEAA